MLYIYDILVNFIDSERIYEFFEWNHKDFIEHIKKIPVVRVDNKTFIDFIYHDISVNDDFLSIIKDKTYTYRETISYACIISNSDRCYALEFDSNGKVAFKSSLLLDEEEEIVECSKKLNEMKIDYTVNKINEINYDLITRKEENDINLIRREIISTYQSDNYEKLYYLYEEVYGIDDLTIEEKYERLLNEINDGNVTSLKKILHIIYLSNKKKKAI